MKLIKTLLFLLVAVTLLPASLLTAQVREYVTADTYTRYELLAPESNSFYIIYEVTETRPGLVRLARPNKQKGLQVIHHRASSNFKN